MKNLELIINSSEEGVELALVEDKNLIELHKENGNNQYTVGDVYLGKVRRVIPELKAAFVDVGYEKDAFLHYSDLGPKFNSYDKFTQDVIQGKQNSPGLNYFKYQPEIEKDGNIKDTVSSGRYLMVQIAKEPISSKGPRISSEVTLAGRYVVLVPFSNKISISQKIKDEKERDRLRKLLSSILPKNFGVIIRTVAENKKVAELDQDLKSLVSRWNKLHKNLKTAKPPKKILGEIDKTSALLRDFLNSTFSNIHVNDEELFYELKNYVESISPGREKIVKHYKGKLDIFEQFGIHKQIKSLFGKQVNLKSGGYLIIEHTEAMHVIDVNSGNRKGANKDYETNALEMNLESAEEIARVLRLRDMGGIIAVDFIDMRSRENNKKLYDFMKEKLSHDRAKHNIAPPSKFGVVEITRQRVRPETDIKTNEKCPSCNGTGEVQASVLIIEEIENHVQNLMEHDTKSFEIHTHPFIEAFIKQGGLKSIQKKWLFKYKKWIPVRGISKHQLLEYNFVNSKNEKIKL